MSSGSVPAAFVLDASVAAAWLLPDEHTIEASYTFGSMRAGRYRAHAPELWLWECGNVIASAVKRSRVNADKALALWHVLDSLRTRIDLATLEPGQVRACLLLGTEHGLSLHDAAYLWLALSLRLPLLSHDRRLSEAAARAGVAVLRLENLP